MYVATSKGTRRRLACKFIPHHCDHQEKMVEVELNCAATLHHPHVVDVLTTFQRDDDTVLLMPYYELGDLQYHFWDPHFRLDLLHVRCIFHQLVSGLVYVHSKNIAHRDIKLENVFIKAVFSKEHPHFYVALGDFGLSKFVEGMTTSYAGTEYSQAPEVVSGGPYNCFKSDVWSLGVVLYIILHKHFNYLRIDMQERLLQERVIGWRGLDVPQ